MENMGAGGYNVSLILTKYAIRKLTPKRWFLFQGYESDFKLPKRKAQSHLYKQAGNSVVITIIEIISKKYNLSLINQIIRTKKNKSKHAVM